MWRKQAFTFNTYVFNNAKTKKPSKVPGFDKFCLKPLIEQVAQQGLPLVREGMQLGLRGLQLF